MKRIIKKILFFVLVCIFYVSCNNREIDYSSMEVDAPIKDVDSSDEYRLDFVSMHNFVIESLQAELTPFFYIVEGGIDIDGNNEEKLIELRCKCLDGCVESDIDLFYAYVLNYIGINAAEQDYRFKSPRVDSTGTYIDFGTVFNVYNLKLYCESESGEIIYNKYIKSGSEIPIESRYIKES